MTGHLTRDTWHMILNTCTWDETYDTWHMTLDTRYLRHDTWQMTVDAWYRYRYLVFNHTDSDIRIFFHTDTDIRIFLIPIPILEFIRISIPDTNIFFWYRYQYLVSVKHYFRVPNNLQETPFMTILDFQAVRFCRRWAGAPGAARLVSNHVNEAKI